MSSENRDWQSVLQFVHVCAFQFALFHVPSHMTGKMIWYVLMKDVLISLVFSRGVTSMRQEAIWTFTTNVKHPWVASFPFLPVLSLALSPYPSPVLWCDSQLAVHHSCWRRHQWIWSLHGWTTATECNWKSNQEAGSRIQMVQMYAGDWLKKTKSKKSSKWTPANTHSWSNCF